MNHVIKNQLPKSPFLSLASISLIQKVFLLLIFIAYNFLRIKMRLAQPFTGDEWYELNTAYEWHDPFHMMLWARADVVRLPFGHEFWIAFYPLLIPQNHPMLIPLVILPHFLSTNLFFYLFAKTNWSFLFGLQKPGFSIQNLFWINIMSLVLITFNQTLIFHSLESRAYAFLPLFALFFLYVAWYAWNSPSFQWRYLIVIIFTILYSIYNAIMLSVALFYIIFIWLWGQWEKSHRFNFPDFSASLQKVLKPYGVTIGIFLAVSLLFPRYLHYDRNVYEFIGPGWSMIRQVFSLLFFCRPIRNFSIPFLVFGVLYMVRKRRVQPIVFVLVFVCLPILTVYLLDLISGYWFLQRQFLWVIPFWAVFVSGCYLAVWEWILEIKKGKKVANEA